MSYREEVDVEDSLDEIDRKTGRPTEYTFELAQEICDNVQLGLTFKDSANLVGIKEGTAASWKTRHPEFARAYAHAKLQRKKVLIASVRVAAKTDWRASLEMLRVLYPEEWARQKLLLMSKQGDKAAELIARVFGEAAAGAEALPDLPDDVEEQLAENAGAIMQEIQDAHHAGAIDVTPIPSHDNPNDPKPPAIDGPAA